MALRGRVETQLRLPVGEAVEGRGGALRYRKPPHVALRDDPDQASLAVGDRECGEQVAREAEFDRLGHRQGSGQADCRRTHQVCCRPITEGMGDPGGLGLGAGRDDHKRTEQREPQPRELTREHGQDADRHEAPAEPTAEARCADGRAVAVTVRGHMSEWAIRPPSSGKAGSRLNTRMAALM